MTNLIPKQLVDKNGVRTTRMVREVTRSASKASIPHPGKPFVTALGVEVAAKEILALTSKGMWNNYTGERVDHSHTVMNTLGWEGVMLVHERMSSLPEEDAFGVGQILMSVLRDRELGSDRAEVVCTMIDAVPVARTFGPRDDPRFLMNNLPLLHSVALEHGVRGLDAATDADRRAVRYLAFRMCVGDYPASRELKEESEWFEKNHEALIPYIDLIRERGANFGWLKDLVGENNLPPLATGLL